MPYQVLVDDNFHYMDESERYQHGEFPTLEAAVQAAERIVDEYLASAYQQGIALDALLASYLMFGEDPFILATGSDEGRGPTPLFSARDYARRRCEELCGGAGAT